MKKILITGTNGYLGQRLAAYLHQNYPGAYETVFCSVRDDGWRAESFRGVDVIYHAAGIVHQEKTKNDPAQAALYDRVNVRLTLALAEKAKTEGVGQFIFLSSAAVYGIDSTVGRDTVITADTPLKPKDLYGKSKAQAEAGLRALECESFRVAIVRPPMIYGAGCKGNYNALSRFGRRLPLFPQISNRRFMLYADNLCERVRLLVDSGEGGVFCPQDMPCPSTSQVVALIAKAHGHRILLVPGFSWVLGLLGRLTDKVGKAFGSVSYAPELCGSGYHRVALEQAIFETEQGG